MSSIQSRKCGQCALKALKGGMCPVFNAVMEEDKSCPYFTTEVKFCDICGQLILMNAVLDIEDDTVHTLCSSCAAADPCTTCKQRPQCAFTQDTTCKEPPQITVQQRQGNMVAQFQQINPKRIQATCANGCPCYWEEGAKEGMHCRKQIGCGCKDYKVNWRN